MYLPWSGLMERPKQVFVVGLLCRPQTGPNRSDFYKLPDRPSGGREDEKKKRRRRRRREKEKKKQKQQRTKEENK